MAAHWDLDDEMNEQQTAASPIKPVVSSELRDAIRDISTIINSNSLSGKMSVCDDELFRLISLCGVAKRLTR